VTKHALRELKTLTHGWLIRCGIDIRRVRADRHVLERRIFPWLLAAPDYRRILFVGCAWYTLHYPRLFSAREFWTMECDPLLARFGGRRHVVDSCVRVGSHFAAESLDVVVCNGVYGFGLDDAAALDDSLRGFHDVLRPGGLLLFGWNNVDAHDPLRLAERNCFAGFRHVRAGPLGAGRCEIPGRNRHTFEFLERLPRAAAA
jgi:SAM-dependent methyltransferase